MSWVVWLLTVPVAALITGGSLLAAGVPRASAIWAGVAAGIVTGIALAALGFTALVECLGEDPDPATADSWPWSPRREFCSDGSSPAALGALALLLVPTAFVMLGTFLRSKGRPALGWAAYAVLIATPALPSLYVDALPVYRLDSHPVLHEPLLRPTRGPRPPRVCYLYGIAFGPRKVEVRPDTTRVCLDLEPTPQARSLTARYDQGRTIFDLDQVGQELTQRGLPVRPGDTGVPGLVVERAYRLPDRRARIGARALD